MYVLCYTDFEVRKLKKYSVLMVDLKNPAHIELKRKIFKAFGLDADKTYKENLKIMGEE